MRMRKIKAFTLAELLIIMAVLAVLMAAFAPMFTSRYTNIATGAVWRKVPADNNGHIYSDAPNKFLLQPSFIGISPQTPEEAKNNYKPYSKVIINSTANNQKQVDFNYNGEKIGSLYALNKNILMGGKYPNDPTGIQNTAFGYEALNSLTSGSNNTAVGYNALSSLNVADNNTAIGYNADIGSGTKNNDAINNVTVGYFSHSATGRENVIIRNKKQSSQISDITSRNIVIGNDTTFVKGAQSIGNVLVGNAASVVGKGNSKSALASYNTAIGANATTPLGSYNTSIGYDSGKQLSNQHNNDKLAHNVTIIDNKDTSSGLNLGAVLNIGDNYNSQNAKYTHVYIGNGTYYGPAALEVHSGFDKISSVIVNGDLIVRGQTFLNSKEISNEKIVAMTVDPYNGNLVLSDHTERNRRMRDVRNDDTIYLPHEKYNASEGCVCSANDLKSYVWTVSQPALPNVLPREQYATNNHYGTFYYSGSLGDSLIKLDAAKGRPVQDSCCPNLQVSDARLKNIGAKFTPSYDELLKLAIYNYSYKTEGKKPTRVGVIAQDLKKIFPNAVSKDQNGYLKIRWDEMFYAMVNAIKDLNAKVQDLVAKVETNKAKINNLKADNKKLEQKLDDLAKEIAKLEK